MHVTLKSILCVLFVVMSLPLQADSMRCGTKLVTLGDTSTQVKFKCGKPDAIEDLGLIKKGKTRYAKLQRIFYRPAQGKLLKILEFHNGKLVKIEYGERI